MKMCAQDIEFTLIRSERKTADIVIERSGDVIVRAPVGIEDEKIREVVADRALWVHRSLAEWEDLNASRRHRPLVQGQGFAYLGRSYRLKFVPDSDVPLRLKNGRWELSEDFVARDGEAAARKAFRDYYIAKGMQIFSERLRQLAPLVGVKPGEVAVKELGYHWASCGTGGAMNFHWKTLMAPQTVIDYIVVHELCHLRHRDHSDAFWNEVDKVLPRYRERKEWLRVNGAALDI
ncbi:metal-dependent hydrolase [Sphingopyxis terrae subsp. terrae NBRC 15098]|uniref:Metal-dependent hydrolase n=1 Tax=Sphingopyxis terrae subsp. terrae NBRC 15098 TaxID=1219058 RepID=A0A142VTP1_9SPHN|nr:SprT family zinc-dependent metalloprotease [Sphingopyxis terrae]AMU93099.1 metal-dependent hydrolase [Sphingopyxis terrae subsp. terrae NBRC 15098]